MPEAAQSLNKVLQCLQVLFFAHLGMCVICCQLEDSLRFLEAVSPEWQMT